VIELVEQNRTALADLCRKYRVKTLEVFGSAANGAFDPERSDLDFLVDFEPMDPGPHAKAYFGVWFGLRDLFDRNVDLVEVRAVTNPYFLKAIEPHRMTAYAT
jgi:predicted nucleotidyltransferase